MVKRKIKNLLLTAIRVSGLKPVFRLPQAMLTTKEWIEKYRGENGSKYICVIPSQKVRKSPPITLEKKVHNIYSREYVHEQPEAFVAVISKARVWGMHGTVITPNNILLKDVSREFGAYGGITGEKHSINRTLFIKKPKKIKGNVAIVGCAGTSNYHHWLYDTFSRFELLKKSGCFEQIDFFILNYKDIKFQKESLNRVGIPKERLIICDHAGFHVEAENLFIPSLPARLGTINGWTVDFLRRTFLEKRMESVHRLYISRRKALSRRLLNEQEVMTFLKSKGFVEFFPEDHSIVDTAGYFANAEFIIGVHGSGFANLAFINSGTKIIDIVAPHHLDPYYWMISQYNFSYYSYLFGVGKRPNEDEDLVVAKVDEDILININDLKDLFNLLEHVAHSSEVNK